MANNNIVYNEKYFKHMVQLSKTLNLTNEFNNRLMIIAATLEHVSYPDKNNYYAYYYDGENCNDANDRENMKLLTEKIKYIKNLDEWFRKIDQECRDNIKILRKNINEILKVNSNIQGSLDYTDKKSHH
jgi:hypothetical protein